MKKSVFVILSNFMGQAKVDDHLWHPTKNAVLRYYDYRCEITFRKKT